MHLCMRVRRGKGKPYCDKDLIISCHLNVCMFVCYFRGRGKCVEYIIKKKLKQVYFLT